jgi:hypothetical protein
MLELVSLGAYVLAIPSLAVAACFLLVREYRR